MKRFLLTALILIATTITIQANVPDISQGTLRVAGKSGDLGNAPLKHTDVKADISGFIARVNVKQEFVNNFSEAIEAVYVFPLSHDGAVDKMTMRIGSRVINGVIMRREEARQTYEAAKQSGRTAALLDQERPNIFTQSIANILPGERIIIEISYVETLKYDNGSYEFVFPMVVAPRYIPGSSNGKTGGGTAPDTDQVVDASRITPAVAKSRAGHDISLSVNINAGVPIESITSELHKTNTQDFGTGSAAVRLDESETIPNRDFILHYDVTGKRIEDAVLVHRDGRGGFFSMILQPPDDMTVEDITPKEIVFVLDTSGSMSGYPIEKAKEAMLLSIDGLHPRDTFNIITFAGSTKILFKGPVPATPANLEIAKSFLKSTNGNGGTEMMTAIKAALDPTDSQEHLRIVCFMTDGQIGNDMAIISEIQKHKNARVFSFGIGNSVNRFLLEKMAEEGNGEAEIVTLESESKAAAERFYKRVRTPLLTDLSIDWNGLPVEDVYPSKLTDLFTAKPVVVNGRFTETGKGTITLKGKVAGQDYQRDIDVDFPEAEEQNDVLATLWARRKVGELMNKDLAGIQTRSGDPEIQQQITNIGLEFNILTQFTSFVAVEERVVNPDGNPARVDVQVENPDGQVKVEGVYQDWKSKDLRYVVSGGSGGGSGSGSGGGIGSGNASSSAGGSLTPALTPSGTPLVFSPQSGLTNSAVTVESSDTKISTSITKEAVDALPKGTTFSSLLTIAPNTRAESLSGGFQADGASAIENAFVVYDGQTLRNFRTAASDVAGDGDDDISASVATLMKPEIPAKAKWTEQDSVVQVDFAVDVEGKVVKAKAVSGNKNLKKPSEQAAMGSTFTPPEFDGDKIAMSGRLAYKFVDRENVEITLEAMRVELSPVQRRQYTKKYKLHFWIYALVERLDKGVSEPTKFEGQFVTNGIADVRVILNDGIQDGAGKLAKAGLQVYKANGTMVYGRISIDKLYDLAELDIVRYISP